MMGIIEVAKACHQVNKAYCEALGDHSQVVWEDASEGQKASVIDGVRLILDHPDTTPEEAHENWRKWKIADGWTYGKVKDEKKKTHPDMVPFDQLPVEQRAKDFIFNAVVHIFM
jgi:hypothetical protein